MRNASEAIKYNNPLRKCIDTVLRKVKSISRRSILPPITHDNITAFIMTVIVMAVE